MMSAGPTPQDVKLHQSNSSQEQIGSMYSVCPDHDNHVPAVFRFSPPPTPNPNCYNDTFSGFPPEWSLHGDSLGLNDDHQPSDASHTTRLNPSNLPFESFSTNWDADNIEDPQDVSSFVQPAICEDQGNDANVCFAPYLAPLESGVFPDNHIDDSLASETADDWQEHFIGPAALSKSLLPTTRARAKLHSQQNGILPTLVPSQSGLQGLGLTIKDPRPALPSGQVDQIINRVNSISIESTRPTRKAFGPVDQRHNHNSRSNYLKSNTKATAGTEKQSDLLSKPPTKHLSQYEEKSLTPNKQLHGRNVSVPNFKPRTGVSAPRPSHELSEATSDHPVLALKHKHSKVQSPSIHLR